MGLFDRTSLFKAADATIGAVLCRVLGRLSYLLARHDSLPVQLRPENVRRILVIRPGGMGDMIILLPLIRPLREHYREAVIDVVCEKRNVEVLKLQGLEDTAMTYDSRPLRFLRRLARRQYDIAVDSEQFHHFSAIFAFLSRAPMRIGFKVNPHRNPLYTHLVSYDLSGPEGLQFMLLLRPLGVIDAPRGLEGLLSGTKTSDLASDIRKELETVSAPYVVIHPGSSSIYKLWPSGRFAELAAALNREMRCGFVIAGGRHDAGASAALAGRIRNEGGRAVSLAGRLNLAETAEIMRTARLFVGSDSGLAHLAVAAGIPTVVLFGPSDPSKWGIEDARHAVVRKPLPCTPCFMFGYHRPCRAIACMEQITVEDVLKACRKVL